MTQDRNTAIIELFRSGASYAEIGRKFGISNTRAREIIKRFERQQLPPTGPIPGLSTRAANVLFHMGLRTREEVAALIQDRGRLRHALRNFPNFGKGTLKDISEALGVTPEFVGSPISEALHDWKSGRCSAEDALLRIDAAHSGEEG